MGYPRDVLSDGVGSPTDLRREGPLFRPGRPRLLAFAILIVLGLFGLALTLPCTLAGCDAHAYWSAWQGGRLYAHLVLEPDTYIYPPPLAQVIYPLTVLPWEAFRAVAAVVAGTSFWWLLRPLPRPVILASIPAVAMAVGVGNLEWLLAVVCVVGFSRPQAWAVALVTKITAGLGLVWFAVRREWRRLASALAITAIVVALSVAVDPPAWRQWLAFARDSAGTLPQYSWALNAWLPLPVRLLAALALLVVGGLSGRRWTVPVAVLLAQPDLNPPSFLILAALPRTA